MSNDTLSDPGPDGISPDLVDHIARALLDYDRTYLNPLRSWADIHRRGEYRERARVALGAAATWQADNGHEPGAEVRP